jgi:DNA repair protein RadC
LRERLFTSGSDALQDYELLELLLGAALPRSDVKLLTITILITTGAIALRADKGQIFDNPLLSSWQRIADYCQMALAYETKEQLRLLFLDRRNQLVHEQIMQHGTIDHTPVYPGEIMQRALELGAERLCCCITIPASIRPPARPTST